MAGPVADIIDALRMTTGTLSEAAVHDIVKRAYWPTEPKVPATIVVLYEHLAVTGVMSGAITLERANEHRDQELVWWDSRDETWRTWDWICERNGDMRIYLPADSIGDGCCSIDRTCGNGCGGS